MMLTHDKSKCHIKTLFFYPMSLCTQLLVALDGKFEELCGLIKFISNSFLLVTDAF